MVDLIGEDNFRTWTVNIVVKLERQDWFLLQTVMKMAEGVIGQAQFDWTGSCKSDNWSNSAG